MRHAFHERNSLPIDFNMHAGLHKSACQHGFFRHAGAFVYDVEEDKLNEAGVRAAVWDEMTFYHPEALNMKRL